MAMSLFRAVITFKSAVHALMGEEAIAAAGLRVGVMSRPMELGSDCGFCLRVGSEDLERALEALAKAGLRWQGAYHDNPGGQPRFSQAGDGGASGPDEASGAEAPGDGDLSDDGDLSKEERLPKKEDLSGGEALSEEEALLKEGDLPESSRGGKGA
jgi:bacterioferritin-associated ferredoxin